MLQIRSEDFGFYRDSNSWPYRASGGFVLWGIARETPLSKNSTKQSSIERFVCAPYFTFIIISVKSNRKSYMQSLSQWQPVKRCESKFNFLKCTLDFHPLFIDKSVVINEGAMFFFFKRNCESCFFPIVYKIRHIVTFREYTSSEFLKLELVRLSSS